MKKLIITESQFSDLLDNKKIEDLDLPKFIVDSIKEHKTSLGEHPCFPPTEEIVFEEKILKKRLFELIQKIKKIGDLEGDYTKNNLTNKLGKYINQVKVIEKDIVGDLEKICFEFVLDTFKLPYDGLNIECDITDDIELKQSITPRALVEIDFESTDELLNIKDEVYKRRLINSLIQGASVRLSSNTSLLPKIYELNQKLPELYYNITTINDYLSFIREQVPSEDTVAGSVVVSIASNEPKIKSDGIIFPVMLFETFKGVMELISVSGLPDSKEIAEYVIGKSDFLLSENWDKRFGVGLWDIIIQLIGSDDMDLTAKVFSTLVSMPTKDFFKITKEIFGKTKKGKFFVSKLIQAVKEVDTLKQIENTLTVDDDEYLSIEDLSSNDSIEESTALGTVGDYQYDVPMFGDKETLDHKNIIAKSIEDGLKEEYHPINNILQKPFDSDYTDCSLSDLNRLQAFEDFFDELSVNENYNTQQPDLSGLKYNDFYIQNNLKNNKLIFFEKLSTYCLEKIANKINTTIEDLDSIIEYLINKQFKKIEDEYDLKLYSYKLIEKNNKNILIIEFISTIILDID